jgi:hypothetical protein
MHRPLCLLISLRVGRISIFPPNLGFGSGLPRHRSLLVEPASDSSGFPASSALRRCRRSRFRLPRTLMAFSVAGFSRVPGCPGGSRLFLRRLRYGSQVAPRSIPPALPAMDRRVASILTSFGGAGCESSRLPLLFALPVSPTISTRVAPNAYLRYRLTSFRVTSEPVPSGSPTDRISGSLRLLALGSSIDQSAGRPESWIFRCRRFRLSRVAPKLTSSADPYLLPQVALVPHLRLGR